MISGNIERIPGYGPEYRNFYGLSTDTKPTANVDNGSTFVEIDTGKLYFFDGDAADWVEWGA